MTDAINTVRTREHTVLITDVNPQLEDCHYRMLKPHEIQAAMAFPSDYIILGNNKQQVKQLGNAVTPPVMNWLIGQCKKTLE